MATERISFGSHYKFPLKLYQVADDETIIKWTDDGTAVVVEQFEFEENVMCSYPGFVQVKSFHNLRRLFRDYGFRFQVLRKRKPCGLKLKFRHPFFTRAMPGNVVQVRKISRRHPFPKDTTKHLPRRHLPCTYFSQQRVLKCYKYEHKLKSELDIMRAREKYTWSSCVPSTLDDHYTDTMLLSVEVLPVKTGPPQICHQTHVSETVRVQLTPDDNFRLAQILAKNELSEAEFWQLVARRRGQDWTDKSWDATMKLLTNIVTPELSLLHHKGFYYQLPIEDL